MPLKKSDDISTWIKDFQKSDDPRFDGKSKEKRREMAIAAHLSAQDEDNKAYNKGVAADKKDDRDDHFDKQAKMSDDDPNAYKPAPGDKDKDGEMKKTKLSKHTKKYRQMYGEDMKQIEEMTHKFTFDNLKSATAAEKSARKHNLKVDSGVKGKTYYVTVTGNYTNIQKLVKNMNEEKEPIEEKIAGLEKKAKKSGISYSILKQVYDRGMAAWKTGHRPGASQQQWAFARVNSFITKGSGTWGKADKDLAAKVRKEDVTRQELADALEEKKKGLWANMHAKRKRGEPPAKPGDPDYPEKLPEDMMEKVECPKCQGDGCSHCDDLGYHMQERKSTVPELMQVNIKGEGGVTVRAKTEKEALKIALRKMKIQPRFANDKKFMAKVQIIPAESVSEGKNDYEEVVFDGYDAEDVLEYKSDARKYRVKISGRGDEATVAGKGKDIAKFLTGIGMMSSRQVKDNYPELVENKLKDLAIQFADEMKELSKLIKNRKDRIAAEKMAGRVEKGDMRAAGAMFQNLDASSKAIVAGSFASLFGDRVAKQYNITEDTSDYATYISKTTYK